MTQRERDELIEQWTPYVRSQAWRLARRSCQKSDPAIDVEDLIGFGLVALLECTRKYRPEVGATFGGYIQKRIHGAMIDALRRPGQRGNSDAVRSLSPLEDYRIYQHPAFPRLLDVRRALVRGMRDLNENERAMIRYKIEGWTLKELSERFGLGFSTLMQLSSRAVGKMRSCCLSDRRE